MRKTIKSIMLAMYVCVCGMLLCGVTAEAYVDPSVMTYLIQAIAGVIIAIGAAIGIYFRRAKKKINDKLGIDENRNKEVETDEIIIKDEK